MLGNTYGTYGEIDEDSVLELFEEHPELETYLKERILRTYDDDLKVFLMEAFNHIDYLHDLPNEILLHIAFSMEARKMEKDEIVFLEEDNYENMLIILDGCLELYTHMDSGTEFPIEYLSSGSVINAHQFMIDRKALVSVRCAKATTFYTLSAEKFFEIADTHPQLLKIRNTQYEQAIDDKKNQTYVLDYSVGFDAYKLDLKKRQENSKKTYEKLSGNERIERLERLRKLKMMPNEQIRKSLDCLGKLKQCTMEVLAKKRLEYKLPSLSEVYLKIQDDRLKEKEKMSQMKNMSIEDLFAEPGIELSEENFSKITKLVISMANTSDNNNIRANNLVK